MAREHFNQAPGAERLRRVHHHDPRRRLNARTGIGGQRRWPVEDLRHLISIQPGPMTSHRAWASGEIQRWLA